MPILKSDGQVRICGDYKLTVNQAAKLDSYPIPRIEDLYDPLNGGQTFTKLELSSAYLQLPLDEASKDCTTINTHRGLFRYTRLTLGISSLPSIFQRSMDTLLQDIPHVSVYIDDIFISRKTEADHVKNLDAVLRRLSDAGMTVCKEKCVFQAKEVEYLDYRIDAEGLHPAVDKVRVVVEAPVPRNVSELKSDVGLLNYYGRFLPGLSTVLAPLNTMLTKAAICNWGPKQDESFKASKHLLSSSKVLVHFDAKKDLLLACDTSPYGVWAVLSHRMPDGTEKPIAFASRSLASAERKYSQLEKEGLAVV